MSCSNTVSIARSLHGVGFALTVCILLVAADDPKSQLPPIKLTIHLPADAALDVQGKKVEGSGELRRETLAPTKEAESIYTIKATWTECDTPRTVKRSLRLKAGQEAEVYLNLDLSADEKIILNLINKEREKAGLNVLSADPKLNRAARTHSLNMAKQKMLAHTLDGKGPDDRLKDGGYHFRTYGENCAAGSRTPAAAVQMWLNSPPHKENILTGEFNETGIGIATGQGGAKFYTQVFAVPAEK
jgi:uncharacterized protein (TIGR03000 family)